MKAPTQVTSDSASLMKPRFRLTSVDTAIRAMMTQSIQISATMGYPVKIKKHEVYQETLPDQTALLRTVSFSAGSLPQQTGHFPPDVTRLLRPKALSRACLAFSASAFSAKGPLNTRVSSVSPRITLCRWEL